MLTTKVLQNRYQLKQKLCQNAGRQTWLTEDLQTQELVVVKMLAFHPQMQWEELTLFEREAQVLKNIAHPRIPKYREYFSIDDRDNSGLHWFCLVQNYIPGISLAAIAKEGQTFQEIEAQNLAKDILNILIYLHELSPSVLHRDIKPSNIIYGEEGQFYLVDFGAVQDETKIEGAILTVVGTSGYAPPEQLWGCAVPASDLYALGTTLIHLLTGIPPVNLPQNEMRLDFRDKVNLNPSFINWIEQLIEPTLEKRFNSAREALNFLETSIVVNPACGNISRNNETFVNYKRLILLALGFTILGAAFTFAIVKAIPIFINRYYVNRNLKRKELYGMIYVRESNKKQAVYYRNNSKFVTENTLNGWNKLNIGEYHTNSYKFLIQGNTKAVFTYGISLKSNLKSYAGGVFIVPKITQSNSKTLTESILCETKETGKIFPAKPIYKNGEVTCGYGTIAVK